MERPSSRSQEVVVVLRRSGTRRTDWIWVKIFQIFSIPCSRYKPEDFMTMFNDTVRTKWWDLYFECRMSQELRNEILVRKFDILECRVGTEVVWRFPRSKWTVELHRQKYGTAIQRDWSSCLEKYQCMEPWNLETYRTLVPNSPLCQSSCVFGAVWEFVWKIRLGRRRTRKYLWWAKFWPWRSQKKWNCWYLLRPKRLDTRCKEAHWASKPWWRRYSSHNSVKNLPTSCDRREDAENSTECRRPMVRN